jgi:hypothetical protein
MPVSPRYLHKSRLQAKRPPPSPRPNRTPGPGEVAGGGGVVGPTLFEIALGLGVRFSPCGGRMERQEAKAVRKQMCCMY